MTKIHPPYSLSLDFDPGKNTCCGPRCFKVLANCKRAGISVRVAITTKEKLFEIFCHRHLPACKSRLQSIKTRRECGVSSSTLPECLGHACGNDVEPGHLHDDPSRSGGTGHDFTLCHAPSCQPNNTSSWLIRGSPSESVTSSITPSAS